MDDSAILDLFFSRSETAIDALSQAYGAPCLRMAQNILGSAEDAEECVADGYLAAWNAIPPQRPVRLRAWFFRVVRNRAISRYRTNTAQMRNGAFDTALDELADILPAPADTESALDVRELTALLDRFLADLDPAPATQFPTSIRGGDGLGIGFSQPPIPCLVPAAEPLLTPVEGIEITGAGYVDGQLHIQAYYRDIFRTDNHGFIYFLDSRSEELYCTLSLSLWDDQQTGSYQEYIFDIPPEDLAAYTLWGDFYTSSLHTEGHWQVTFPLDETS